MLVVDKDIVIPGQVLAEGLDYLPSNGTFREENNIIAMQVGVVIVDARLVKVIPLNGRYLPRRNDVVVGKVTDMTYANWFVDIGCAYDAVLSIKEVTSDFIEKGTSLSEILGYGQLIAAKVLHVSKEKVVELTMKGVGLRKLTGGNIIKIAPSKVPRVIGKEGSMVNLLKKYTNCMIYVGQNGKIWISGQSPENEKLATDAIYLIEKNAHISGLTDKIESFLKSATRK